MNPWTCAFNNDGFGVLQQLADTAMTADDAERVLIEPLADSCITLLDWTLLTTGQHNCRTRYGRDFKGEGQGRPCDRLIGDVVQHYAAQPQDLFDVVIARGRARGLTVFGSIRLNHGALNTERLLSCPGRNWGNKKDFRDPLFHEYLAGLVEDIDAKGADGISLDFERKMPFFPPEASQAERFAACTAFLRRVRAATSKPILARVSHDRLKGEPEGQRPEAWIAEGLVDIVVPATSNHDPDTLDWTFDRFLNAARQSPRRCQIWPQIWPTAGRWQDATRDLHQPEAIDARMRNIREMGADGVYFFNFCCTASDETFYRFFKSQRPQAG